MTDFSFGSSNTSVRAWVRERFLPVVMVIADDAIESTCQDKNGLTFLEVLRPFTDQTNLDLPLRISGRNIRIQELRLRLLYPQSIEQQTAEFIDARLKNIVLEEAEHSLKDAPSSLSQIREGKIQSTPWFSQYRQDFLNLLAFDGQETFDHPAGAIVAVASTEVDPVKAIDGLLERTSLPALMMKEYMFPLLEENFGKFYIIVHDGSRDGQSGLELARERLKILQRFYGHDQCGLLLINTSGGREEMRGVPPKPFRLHRGVGVETGPVPAPANSIGTYLSKADLDRINELMRNFVTSCFVPKLDLRLSAMRTNVPIKRHGFASRFMERTGSYLRSSLSGIGRDHGSALGFKYHSEEGQLRQLGDLLFLLQRYEDSLEVFNSILISKDSFPKFYAGVQFMLGLCHSMIVGFADPALYFSKAYDYYLRVPGKTSRMLATRAAMLHSAHCLSTGEVESAAQVLLKGYDTEEILRGALLLEQSAILFLRTTPPSLRKFAFKMALAGVWYYNSMFRKLSLRCYTLILDIYTDKEWDTIEEHIATMMLKFHLEQGDYDSAFNWTMNMLTSHHNLTPYLQKQYIDWVCHFIKEHPDLDVTSLADFNLPVIHTESLEVCFNTETLFGNNLSKQTEKEVWIGLDRRFRDPNSLSTTTTGFQLAGGQLEEDFNLISCGEKITLKCQFQNPLKTQIEVQSAQLLFEFERTDDSCSPTSSPVFIPENSFFLQDSDSQMIELSLIPMTPGRLRIIGVSWYLNGLIPGHKLIGKVSLMEEKEKLPFRAKRRCPTLLFVTLEPVPELRVETGIPEQGLRLWNGEIWKQDWQISTVNQILFRNLQITSSSGDLRFSLPVLDSKDSSKGVVYGLEGEFRDPVFCEVVLNPQNEGRKVFHVVLRYESVNSDTPLRVRYLRYSFQVEVLDGIQIQNSIHCSEIPRSYILSMEMQNRSKDTIFEINRIYCRNPGLDLRHLVQNSESCSFQIAPNDHQLHHFLLSSKQELEGAGLEEISIDWKTEEAKQGILHFSNDLKKLSKTLELSLEKYCFHQVLNEGGIGIIPVVMSLRNVGLEPISVIFQAGDEDLELPTWQESGSGKTGSIGSAGLPVMSPWLWTGQTQRSIPCLKSGEEVKINTEILCFSTGSFTVLNYSCRWRSELTVKTGLVQGSPLYLNMTQKEQLL